MLFEIDTYGNCEFWSGSKLTNLYGTHICMIEKSQKVQKCLESASFLYSVQMYDFLKFILLGFSCVEDKLKL